MMDSTTAERNPLSATERAIVAALARSTRTEDQLVQLAADYGLHPTEVRAIGLAAALEQPAGQRQAVLDWLQADQALQFQLLTAATLFGALRDRPPAAEPATLTRDLRETIETALVRAAALGQAARRVGA